MFIANVVEVKRFSSQNTTSLRSKHEISNDNFATVNLVVFTHVKPFRNSVPLEVVLRHCRVIQNQTRSPVIRQLTAELELDQIVGAPPDVVAHLDAVKPQLTVKCVKRDPVLIDELVVHLVLGIPQSVNGSLEITSRHNIITHRITTTQYDDLTIVQRVLGKTIFGYRVANVRILLLPEDLDHLGAVFLQSGLSD